MTEQTIYDGEDYAAESVSKSSKTRKRNSDEVFHGGYGRTDSGLWRKWDAGYSDKQAEGGER